MIRETIIDALFVVVVALGVTVIAALLFRLGRDGQWWGYALCAAWLLFCWRAARWYWREGRNNHE